MSWVQTINGRRGERRLKLPSDAESPKNIGGVLKHPIFGQHHAKSQNHAKSEHHAKIMQRVLEAIGGRR